MNDEHTFAKAIELSADKREAFLDDVYKDRPDERRRLAAMILAHEQSDNLLDTEAMVAMEKAIPECRLQRNLGDFEIIRELGRGGMGVVYEARQKSLKRKVALKVLSSGLGLSSKAILRFRREAEAAGKLHHTNIVPIYTTGEDKGIHYYAMELIDGPSLDAVIKDLKQETTEKTGKSASDADVPSWLRKTALYDVTGPAPVRTDLSSVSSSSTVAQGSKYFDHVATMIAEVADALEHAHEHGVIHRDIKPSNLLLAPDGRLSVNDFGLARMLEQPGMTMSGEFVGSPLYMSPEQITAGRVAIDHRTDIYSLGATLYELLVLEPPFPGQTRDQVLSQILHKDATAPRKLNRKIPVDLDTICMKAIDKDPDRRYQTAGQFSNDLKNYVNRYAISARRIGIVGKGFRVMRRNPTVTMLAGCLVISLLFVCLGALAWRTHERRDAQSDAMDNIIVGRIDKAEADVERARTWGAGDAWYYRNKGHIMLLRGDLEEANVYLDLAETSGDSSVPLLSLRAIAKFYSGHEQAYFQDTNALLNFDELSIEDHFYLGIALEWSNPREAMSHLKIVADHEERSLAVTMSLGFAKATLAMDEPVPAKAITLVDEAINDLTSCLSDWPNNEKLNAMLAESYLVASQLQQQIGEDALSDKLLMQAKQHCEMIADDSKDSVNGLIKYYYIQYANGFDAAARFSRNFIDDPSRQNNYLASYAIIDAFRLGDPAGGETAYARLEETLSLDGEQQLIRNTKLAYLELARLSIPTSSAEREDYLRSFQEYLDRKSKQKDYSGFEQDWLALRLLGANPDIAMRHAARSAGFFSTFKNPMQHDIVPLCDYLAAETPDDKATIAASEKKNSKRLMATTYFCIAARALAEGRRVEARRYFQSCIDQGEFHYFVHQWSTAFRDKLDNDENWPDWIK